MNSGGVHTRPKPRAVGGTPPTAGGAEGASQLTQRQLDILALLGAGKGNKQIAHELGIGVGTVKQHMVALFRKLNVKNRTMAVSRGLAMGSGEAQPAPAAEDADTVLELRSATVLSVAVAPAGGDGEAARRAWEALQQAAAAVAGRLDCTIVGRPATGLDIIFGLNRVREDDALEALAAARCMAAALASAPGGTGVSPPSLRAGLASGVLLASVAPRGGWTGEVVAGRVIGRARELRDNAPPGVLRLIPESLVLMEFARRGGDGDPLPEGLAVPLWPSHPTTGTESPPVFLPAAIGRSAELSALDRMVGELRHGRGGVVWLEGEAGMGKTTLCRVVAARCAEAGLPWIGLRCGRRPLAESLPSPERPVEGGTPVAVIIDDLHLADAKDAAAVASLAGVAAAAGILLVGSRRVRLPQELLKWSLLGVLMLEFPIRTA